VAGREEWIAVAGDEDDEIRERILTGYKDGKPFTPYVPTLPLPDDLGTVLDFGCGLGRNFPYLTRVARLVVGFDLPPMIERCRAVSPIQPAVLSAEWDAIRTQRFDLIFASLVLQHIEPAPARAFLRDFASMAPLVYLLTRTQTDFGEPMLRIVAETGLYDPGECVVVDHDPITHQLRVLGRQPFASALASTEERHYEVLLKVRG
jgi:SAM-dependent methyltransferase